MKNSLLFLAVLIILCFATSSFAWQGRMEGMDNPSGLVADESDFLIHPAKIVDGAGSNYYGDYKFNYIQVPKWNNVSTYTNANTGSLLEHDPFMAAGSGRDHDTSLGGTWALGPGRLGIFLQYSLREGSYDGTNVSGTTPASHDAFALDTDAESIAVKLLYGLPIGSWKLGMEIGFTHKSHSNFTDQSFGDGSYVINLPLNAISTSSNLFPFMMPVDESWNEASFKASAEKTLGPGVLTFTPRIATVFHGVNKVNFRDGTASAVSDNINGTGKVAGWSTGADLWYRIKLNTTNSLPFLMSVNYDRKKTNVSTVDITSIGTVPDIETSEAKEFAFEIGGGIDKDIAKGTRVASGLYYDYLQSKSFYAFNTFGVTTAYNEYPTEKEHRLVWKTACEHALSPVVTARAGINAFYGWVEDHYNLTETVTSNVQDMRTSGHRWGLTGSVGATVKAAKLDIEPFIATGLRKTSMDTNSGSLDLFGVPYKVNLQNKKSEWTVGGGVSIKLSPFIKGVLL